jgi:hypothetical protein
MDSRDPRRIHGLTKLLDDEWTDFEATSPGGIDLIAETKRKSPGYLTL